MPLDNAFTDNVMNAKETVLVLFADDAEAHASTADADVS